MGYDAFISYGHAGDAGLAPALAAGLQRLAKPWWRRRALQVFCDTSNLSANPALWSSIADSMSQSSYLVVLASADSAQSPWVAREIEHWRATKEPGRILLALTDGALVWDAARGDFDAEQSTALSPALLGAFTEEPLYVDLSDLGDDANLTLRNPRFMDAVADLAAPIHGVAKDELVGEDLRQHRRTLYVAWGAAFAVVILAIASIVGAFIARDKADEAQQRAEEVLAANRSADKALALRDKARRAADKAHRTADQAAALRDEATAARDLANKDRDRASDDARAAQLERTAAQLEADAAEAEAAAAQSEAEASAQLANEKAAEALVASQEAARQEGLAAAAEGNAATATANKNRAEAATADAVRKADEADAQAELAMQAEARATLAAAQAEQARGIAEAAATLANEQAQNSEAVARASGLAAASQQPDLVDDSLDTSLLLALASTLVEPASASAAAMEPPSPAAPTNATRDALAHVTADARDGIRNHLQFSGHNGPLEMRTSAMATRGNKRIVAAGETSHAIQGDKQADRLYVWFDALNTTDRAVELSAGEPLDCLRELHFFDHAHKLVSVEDPKGCLNTTPDFGEFFVRRTVRIWDLDNPASPPEKYTGISQLAYSPIAIAPNEGLLAIQQLYGTRVIEAGIAGSKKLYGFNLNSAIVGTESIAGAGAYLVGTTGDLDDLQQLNGATWRRADGSQKDYAPRMTFDPDATVLGVAVGQFALLYDPVTGDQVDGLNFGNGTTVCSLGLGRNGDLVVTVSGDATCSSGVVIARYNWLDLGEPVAWAVFFDASPTGRIGLSPQGRWLTVDRLDDASGGTVRVVFDAATGERRADLEGDIVQFDQNEERYVVSQERSADPATDGFKIRVVAWDLEHAPAAPVLTQADADVVPAPDGRSVAVFPTALPVLGNDFPVTVWPLDPIGLAVGVRELPSPAGSIHAVAFDGDGLVAGFGATSAGIVWDPPRHHDETIDTVAPSGVNAQNPCRPEDADARVTATSPLDARLRALSPDGTSLVLRAIHPDDPTAVPVDVTVGIPVPGGSHIDHMSFTRGGNFLIVDYFEPTPAEFDPTEPNPCKLSGSLVVEVGLAGGTPTAGAVHGFPGEEALASSGDGSRISFLAIETSSTHRAHVLVRDTANLSSPAAWAIDTTLLGEDDNPSADNLFVLDWHGDRLVGTNSSAKAVVWARGTPQPIRTYQFEAQPTANVAKQGAAWANDGRLALKWSDDIVRLFDVDAAGTKPIATKRLSSKAALRLRFSDDGTLLLADGIFVLDGHTLASIGPRLHPDRWISFLDFGTVETFFTHDGNYVVAQRSDGSEVVRWPVGLDLLRAEACSKAGRNLTPAEAQLFNVASPNALCPAYGPDGA